MSHGSGSARDRCRGFARGDRLAERGAALEPHLALRERPRREVDVGVAEPRDDAAPAEIDALRRRQRRLVRADASRDPVTCDRERRRASEATGSIVRIVPPGKDHA